MDLSSIREVTRGIPPLKDYPRRYRPYFATGKAAYFKPVLPERITLYSPYGDESSGHVLPNGKPDRYWNLRRYEADFRELFRRMDDNAFADGITYIWMRGKFGYQRPVKSGGFKKPPNTVKGFYRHGHEKDFLADYGSFLDTRVGAEQKWYFPEGLLYLLNRYVYSFYGPGEFFGRSNPLETPPVQPFRNLRLCHYAAVAAIDERLSLLQEADRLFAPRDGMLNQYSPVGMWPKFLDWLYNWVQGYNAEFGETYVMVSWTGKQMAAVRRIGSKYAPPEEWLPAGESETVKMETI